MKIQVPELTDKNQFLKQFSAVQSYNLELQLSKTCHTECGGWYVGFKKRFRAPRNGVATVHHAVSWKHETSPQQYWDFETGFSSAAD